MIAGCWIGIACSFVHLVHRFLALFVDFVYREDAWCSGNHMCVRAPVCRFVCVQTGISAFDTVWPACVCFLDFVARTGRCQTKDPCPYMTTSCSDLHCRSTTLSNPTLVWVVRTHSSQLFIQLGTYQCIHSASVTGRHVLSLHTVMNKAGS